MLTFYHRFVLLSVQNQLPPVFGVVAIDIKHAA